MSANELSDEEIEAIYTKAFGFGLTPGPICFEFARAIAAADRSLRSAKTDEGLNLARGLIAPNVHQAGALPTPPAATAELSALASRLRNGDWNLRSPQELADIIADAIEAALPPNVASMEPKP